MQRQQQQEQQQQQQSQQPQHNPTIEKQTNDHSTKVDSKPMNDTPNTHATTTTQSLNSVRPNESTITAQKIRIRPAVTSRSQEDD